jgi:hypothetical protein
MARADYSSQNPIVSGSGRWAGLLRPSAVSRRARSGANLRVPGRRQAHYGTNVRQARVDERNACVMIRPRILQIGRLRRYGILIATISPRTRWDRAKAMLATVSWSTKTASC